MQNLTWNITHLPSCGSTNVELKALLTSRRAAPRDVLITDNQWQGRGRLDRHWVSPTGNLALSLACPLLNPEKVYQLNLVAGYSLARTIEQCAGLKMQIKWPNDVLVDGKKIAGILSEAVREVDAVIIGVGVNLNSTRTDFPQDLRTNLCTIRDHKEGPLDRDIFVAAFLRQIDIDLQRYKTNGLEDFLAEINSQLAFHSEMVSVHETGTPAYEARVLGINADGWLTLQTNDATERLLIAGEIRPRT